MFCSTRLIHFTVLKYRKLCTGKPLEILWGRNHRTCNLICFICVRLFWRVSFNSRLALRGKALKLPQARISVPCCSPCCTCCIPLVSGRVTCKQSPVCVAVNEAFGNRERLVLASASSSGACGSAAGSSGSNSETAMETWRTKHHKIKVINGTTTNVHSTNPRLVRVHRNYLCLAICRLLHLKETRWCG